MPLTNRMRPCGDDLISIDAADPANAQTLATHLRLSGEWLDVVGGIDSVVVHFDAARLDFDEARQMVGDALLADVAATTREACVVEIPVRYGGEGGADFEDVCATLGLSADEFVALHTAGRYTVDMLGFTPGFAYIGGLDERLDVARLENPRTRVEAGSVGIADGRTGLYALPGPGGWPLIGRTSFPLFDPSAEEPFALTPGDEIRFVVDR